MLNTNNLVGDFKHMKLRVLRKLVISIEALEAYRPHEAWNASYEETGNPYKIVYLQGAKIRLTRNIWRLVSNCCVVHDTVWPAGAGVRQYWLNVKYECPVLFIDEADNRPVVPIFPLRRDFEL